MNIYVTNPNSEPLVVQFYDQSHAIVDLEKELKNGCIDFDLGSDIRINRVGIFCLRQKAKSSDSASLRHRVDDSPILFQTHTSWFFQALF
jgi:hypothetical protein